MPIQELTWLKIGKVDLTSTAVILDLRVQRRDGVLEEDLLQLQLAAGEAGGISSKEGDTEKGATRADQTNSVRLVCKYGCVPHLGIA